MLMLAKRKHDLTRLRRRAATCLRQLREEAKLSQRELAVRLGITHVAVHKLETGLQRVELPLFCWWAKACRQEPAEVLATLLGIARKNSFRGPS